MPANSLRWRKITSKGNQQRQGQQAIKQRHYKGLMEGKAHTNNKQRGAKQVKQIPWSIQQHQF